MIESLGGRKMILALLSVVVGAGLYIVKGSISTEMVALLLGVVGAFNLGNVQATKLYTQAQAAPVVGETAAPSSLELGALAEIDAKVNALVGAATDTGRGVAYIAARVDGAPPNRAA